MSYAVELTESHFEAQVDGVVRNITIGDQLRETAGNFPDAIGLVEVDINGEIGRRLTYQELLTISEAMACTLAGRFAPGERVTVWSPNTPEWVLMEFACALAGIVIVTANPALQSRELKYIVEQSGSVALFLVGEYRGNPMKARLSCGHAIFHHFHDFFGRFQNFLGSVIFKKLLHNTL